MTELFTIEPSEPPPLELARIQLERMREDLEQNRNEMSAMKIAWAEGDIRAQERERTTMNTPEPENPPAKDMSLRDYFAAKAMQGMLADSTRAGNGAAYAEDAYDFADAMLAERMKARAAK